MFNIIYGFVQKYTLTDLGGLPEDCNVATLKLLLGKEIVIKYFRWHEFVINIRKSRRKSIKFLDHALLSTLASIKMVGEIVWNAVSRY